MLENMACVSLSYMFYYFYCFGIVYGYVHRAALTSQNFSGRELQAKQGGRFSAREPGIAREGDGGERAEAARICAR